MHALQDRYQVQELSTYQGIATPPVEPPFAKIKPIDVRKESESPQFFAILNAMLAYMPMLNEEAGLRSRLVKIGVVSGATFYISDDVTRTALVEGMRQGLTAMYTRAQSVRSSAELFGSRTTSRTIISAVQSVRCWAFTAMPPRNTWGSVTRLILKAIPLMAAIATGLNLRQNHCHR